MTPKTALKVMLLTGMRPSEAFAMRWDQVDLDVGKVWFGMTETTDYRQIALSSWSIAQLKRLERMIGRHEYVLIGPKVLPPMCRIEIVEALTCEAVVNPPPVASPGQETQTAHATKVCLGSQSQTSHPGVNPCASTGQIW